MTYRIEVKTVRNNILTFNGVSDYKVVDGYVVFTDSRTGKTKRFAVSNTDIEQEEKDNKRGLK